MLLVSTFLRVFFGKKWPKGKPQISHDELPSYRVCTRVAQIALKLSYPYSLLLELFEELTRLREKRRSSPS